MLRHDPSCCFLTYKNDALAQLGCFKNKKKSTIRVIDFIKSNKIVSFSYMIEKSNEVNGMIFFLRGDNDNQK